MRKVLIIPILLFLAPVVANAVPVIDQSMTEINCCWDTISDSQSYGYQQTIVAGQNNIIGAGLYLIDHPDESESYIGTLTIEVFDGLVSDGGSLVASGTADFSSVGMWVDVFWSAQALSIGDTYALRIGGAGGTYFSYGRGNEYAFGEVYDNSGHSYSSEYDLSFRTWYDDEYAAVPEPATLALFGLGLAGIGFSRRKKA